MRDARGSSDRRRVRWRAPSAGDVEQGLSLLELVVALTVFALIMVGVVATTDRGLDLVRQNRHRAVAASLAAQEMDRVRSADFSTVEPAEEQVDVGAVTYTVRREVTWIDQDATGGACDGGAEDPALLRVRVVVTWPGIGGVAPVTSDSVLSPPVGTYDAQTGHIAVQVLDRDADARLAVPVTLSGPEQRSAPTNGDGCAFFAFLPPGTYTVALAAAGHVDRQGDPEPAQQVGVASGTTVSVQFDYDHAATLELTLAGDAGGEVPDGVDVRLANTHLLPAGIQTFPGSGPVRVIGDRFPALAGYAAFAGACSVADPEGDDYALDDDLGEYLPTGPAWPGATRAPAIAVDPGGAAVGTVELRTVEVSVLSSGGGARPGVTVSAAHAPDLGCPEGVVHPLGTTDEAGSIVTALPFGTWTLEVDGDLPASGSWPAVVADPTVAGPVPVTVEVEP